MAEESFSQQMRKATRDVHAVSDALVNAKLLFALSDNSVWAEGLVVFYEIFRYLEVSMKEEINGNLGQLLLDGLERTEAWEKDLNFYLGENWEENYQVRDEVAQYLVHLQRLRAEDPDLLIAYVYHLYMGLLSGGQILTRKRQIRNSLYRRNNDSSEGYEITNFGSVTVYSLKKLMKERVNEIALTLSEEKRARLIDESKKVFELNNVIIKTVKGTGRVIVEKLVYLVLLMFIAYYAYYLLTN